MQSPGLAGAALRLAARRREAFMLAARHNQIRAREARARLARTLIACALFVALVSAGWAVRMPAVIGFLSQHGIIQGQAHGHQQEYVKATSPDRPGQIVHELPDGLSCRFLPFDNITGWFELDKVGPCEDDSQKRVEAPPRQFKWGEK
jgi:hypothetical protein